MTIESILKEARRNAILIQKIVETQLPLLKNAERLRAQLEWMIKNFISPEQVLQQMQGEPGTLLGDLWRVYRSRSTDKEKIEAAKRLINGYFKRPIYWKRWSALDLHIRKTLEKRAEDHSTEPTEEIRRATLSGLFIAIQEIGPRYPREWFKSVRTKLNDLVTDDFVDDHRHIHRKEPYDGQEPKETKEGLEAFEDIEAKMLLEGIARVTSLSNEEKELLVAFYFTGDIKNFAEEHGMKLGAVYTKLHRTREKLKKERHKIL